MSAWPAQVFVSCPRGCTCRTLSRCSRRGDLARGGTMSFGIIEVITLLLGLSGLGLTANPKAPTADQALQYAIAEPDVAVYIDLASVLPGNIKVLGQVADQPQIKASPELAATIRKAVAEIEGARGVAKMTIGIDVATDITDATLFTQILPGADQRFVLAVHGRFTADHLNRAAALAKGSVQKIGGGGIVDAGPQEPAFGLTRDGVLLAGTVDLVRERLEDAWRPPAHGAGTNLGYMAEMITARPVFAVVATLSAVARTEALGRLDGQSFATDLLQRHKA